MTLDELKSELRDAPPEVREELYTLLCALRRAQDPERGRHLAAKLADPARWVSAEEAAARLGLPSAAGQ